MHIINSLHANKLGNISSTFENDLWCLNLEENFPVKKSSWASIEVWKGWSSSLSASSGISLSGVSGRPWLEPWPLGSCGSCPVGRERGFWPVGRGWWLGIEFSLHTFLLQNYQRVPRFNIIHFPLNLIFHILFGWIKSTKWIWCMYVCMYVWNYVCPAGQWKDNDKSIYLLMQAQLFNTRCR